MRNLKTIRRPLPSNLRSSRSPLCKLENSTGSRRLASTLYMHWLLHYLPPFSLIRDFGKQNTRGNVSKISVSLACYRQIGSKSINHSPLAWRKEGQKVTLVAVIGGFRSVLSITRKTVTEILETFPWVFCFPKLRINENGGKCRLSAP